MTSAVTGNTHTRRRALMALAGAAVTALVAGPVAAGTAAAAPAPAPAGPAVSGPITGGQHGVPFGSFAHAPADLVSAAGYTEQEFFFGGTATKYAADGDLGADGNWKVKPDGTSPYQTRALVERPAAGKFNGTVVVEWLNVSAGSEGAPDFVNAHDELLRKGYAYVAISAQKIGIDSLKKWDADRYGALNVPGDGYSYDIFTQAAAAVRDPNGLFKGLPVKHVIADGESQSAFRLTTYVDAFQPKTKAFDGFLLHSRAGGAAPLGDNGPLTSTTSNPLIGPPLAKIRADNATPVLQLETESDVNAHILGFFNARQPDNGKLRTWELAGASHADAYALKLYGPQASALLPPCDKPMNAGYAQHYIVGSAFRALDTWTNWGQAPRSGQQLSTDANGAINRDANGIAKGGIRTWSVDVPISTETGEANSPAGFCSLFGTSTPFSADQIKKLYPTHQKYVDRVRLSTAFDGFLLSEDKKTVVDEANKSTIGN